MLGPKLVAKDDCAVIIKRRLQVQRSVVHDS